jgi:ATP/ADP translocase
MQPQKKFTCLRAHFWPVKMTDMKKFIPLLIILKGMAFFYVGKSEQTKGRIIVEFIGTMILGKSLSSYIIKVLLMSQHTKDVSNIAPFLLGIIFVLGVIMFGVLRLMNQRIRAVEHA